MTIQFHNLDNLFPTILKALQTHQNKISSILPNPSNSNWLEDVYSQLSDLEYKGSDTECPPDTITLDDLKQLTKLWNISLFIDSNCFNHGTSGVTIHIQHLPWNAYSFECKYEPPILHLLKKIVHRQFRIEQAKTEHIQQDISKIQEKSNSLTKKFKEQKDLFFSKKNRIQKGQTELKQLKEKEAHIQTSLKALQILIDALQYKDLSDDPDYSNTKESKLSSNNTQIDIDSLLSGKQLTELKKQAETKREIQSQRAGISGITVQIDALKSSLEKLTELTLQLEEDIRIAKQQEQENNDKAQKYFDNIQVLNATLSKQQLDRQPIQSKLTKHIKKFKKHDYELELYALSRGGPGDGTGENKDKQSYYRVNQEPIVKAGNRGLHIIYFNGQTGIPIRSYNYDLYKNSSEHFKKATQALEKFTEYQKKYTSVALVIYIHDEATDGQKTCDHKILEKFLNTLNELGLKSYSSLNYRDPMCFIKITNEPTIQFTKTYLKQHEINCASNTTAPAAYHLELSNQLTEIDTEISNTQHSIETEDEHRKMAIRQASEQHKIWTENEPLLQSIYNQTNQTNKTLNTLIKQRDQLNSLPGDSKPINLSPEGLSSDEITQLTDYTLNKTQLLNELSNIRSNITELQWTLNTTIPETQFNNTREKYERDIAQLNSAQKQLTADVEHIQNTTKHWIHLDLLLTQHDFDLSSVSLNKILEDVSVNDPESIEDVLPYIEPIRFSTRAELRKHFIDLQQFLIIRTDALETLFTQRIYDQFNTDIQKLDSPSINDFISQESDLFKSINDFSQLHSDFTQSLGANIPGIEMATQILFESTKLSRFNFDDEPLFTNLEIKRAFLFFSKSYLDQTHFMLRAETARRQKIEGAVLEGSEQSRLEKAILDEHTKKEKTNLKILEQQKLLAQEKNQLTQRLQEYEALKNAHESQLGELNIEQKKLSQAFEEAKQYLAQLQNEHNTSATEIDIAQNNLDILAQQKKALKAQVNETLSAYNQAIDNFNTTQNRLTNIKSRQFILQAELKASEKELQKAEDAIKAFEGLQSFYTAFKTAFEKNELSLFKNETQRQNILAKLNKLKSDSGNALEKLFDFLVSLSSLASLDTEFFKAIVVSKFAQANNAYDTLSTMILAILDQPKIEFDMQRKYIKCSGFSVNFDDIETELHKTFQNIFKQLGLKLNTSNLLVRDPDYPQQEHFKLSDLPKNLFAIISKYTQVQYAPDKNNPLPNIKPTWSILNEKGKAALKHIESLSLSYEKHILPNWVNHIEIQIGRNLYIDSDISLPSIALTIMAKNNIYLKDDCTIDTSGLDAPQYKISHGLDGSKYRQAGDEPSGANGQDGLPGFAGESGGHIFMRAFGDIENIDSLTCIANGGKGGNGQTGGKGDQGKSGEDGRSAKPPKCEEGGGGLFGSGFLSSGSTCTILGEAPKLTEKNKSGDGGHGGQAGLKGEGGFAGEIWIESSKPQSNLQPNTTAIAGKSGQDGGQASGGLGGEGAYPGNDYISSVSYTTWFICTYWHYHELVDQTLDIDWYKQNIFGSTYDRTIYIGGYGGNFGRSGFAYREYNLIKQGNANDPYNRLFKSQFSTNLDSLKRLTRTRTTQKSLLGEDRSTEKTKTVRSDRSNKAQAVTNQASSIHTQNKLKREVESLNNIRVLTKENRRLADNIALKQTQVDFEKNKQGIIGAQKALADTESTQADAKHKAAKKEKESTFDAYQAAENRLKEVNQNQKDGRQDLLKDIQNINALTSKLAQATDEKELAKIKSEINEWMQTELNHLFQTALIANTEQQSKHQEAINTFKTELNKLNLELTASDHKLENLHAEYAQLLNDLQAAQEKVEVLDQIYIALDMAQEQTHMQVEQEHLANIQVDADASKQELQQFKIIVNDILLEKKISSKKYNHTAHFERYQLLGGAKSESLFLQSNIETLLTEIAESDLHTTLNSHSLWEQAQHYFEQSKDFIHNLWNGSKNNLNSKKTNPSFEIITRERHASKLITFIRQSNLKLQSQKTINIQSAWTALLTLADKIDQHSDYFSRKIFPLITQFANSLFDQSIQQLTYKYGQFFESDAELINLVKSKFHQVQYEFESQTALSYHGRELYSLAYQKNLFIFCDQSLSELAMHSDNTTKAYQLKKIKTLGQLQAFPDRFFLPSSQTRQINNTQSNITTDSLLSIVNHDFKTQHPLPTNVSTLAQIDSATQFALSSTLEMNRWGENYTPPLPQITVRPSNPYLQILQANQTFQSHEILSTQQKNIYANYECTLFENTLKPLNHTTLAQLPSTHLHHRLFTSLRNNYLHFLNQNTLAWLKPENIDAEIFQDIIMQYLAKLELIGNHYFIAQQLDNLISSAHIPQEQWIFISSKILNTPSNHFQKQPLIRQNLIYQAILDNIDILYLDGFGNDKINQTVLTLKNHFSRDQKQLNPWVIQTILNKQEKKWLEKISDKTHFSEDEVKQAKMYKQLRQIKQMLENLSGSFSNEKTLKIVLSNIKNTDQAINKLSTKEDHSNELFETLSQILETLHTHSIESLKDILKSQTHASPKNLFNTPHPATLQQFISLAIESSIRLPLTSIPYFPKLISSVLNINKEKYISLESLQQLEAAVHQTTLHNFKTPIVSWSEFKVRSSALSQINYFIDQGYIKYIQHQLNNFKNQFKDKQNKLSTVEESLQKFSYFLEQNEVELDALSIEDSVSNKTALQGNKKTWLQWALTLLILKGRSIQNINTIEKLITEINTASNDLNSIKPLWENPPKASKIKLEKVSSIKEMLDLDIQNSPSNAPSETLRIWIEVTSDLTQHPNMDTLKSTFGQWYIQQSLRFLKRYIFESEDNQLLLEDISKQLQKWSTNAHKKINDQTPLAIIKRLGAVDNLADYAHLLAYKLNNYSESYSLKKTLNYAKFDSEQIATIESIENKLLPKLSQQLSELYFTANTTPRFEMTEKFLDHLEINALKRAPKKVFAHLETILDGQTNKYKGATFEVETKLTSLFQNPRHLTHTQAMDIFYHALRLLQSKNSVFSLGELSTLLLKNTPSINTLNLNLMRFILLRTVGSLYLSRIHSLLKEAPEELLKNLLPTLDYYTNQLEATPEKVVLILKSIYEQTVEVISSENDLSHFSIDSNQIINQALTLFPYGSKTLEDYIKQYLQNIQNSHQNSTSISLSIKEDFNWAYGLILLSPDAIDHLKNIFDVSIMLTSNNQTESKHLSLATLSATNLLKMHSLKHIENPHLTERFSRYATLLGNQFENDNNPELLNSTIHLFHHLFSTKSSVNQTIINHYLSSNQTLPYHKLLLSSDEQLYANQLSEPTLLQTLNNTLSENWDTEFRKAYWKQTCSKLIKPALNTEGILPFFGSANGTDYAGQFDNSLHQFIFSDDYNITQNARDKLNSTLTEIALILPNNTQPAYELIKDINSTAALKTHIFTSYAIARADHLESAWVESLNQAIEFFEYSQNTTRSDQTKDEWLYQTSLFFKLAKYFPDMRLPAHDLRDIPKQYQAQRTLLKLLSVGLQTQINSGLNSDSDNLKNVQPYIGQFLGTEFSSGSELYFLETLAISLYIGQGRGHSIPLELFEQILESCERLKVYENRHMIEALSTHSLDTWPKTLEYYQLFKDLKLSAHNQNHVAFVDNLKILKQRAGETLIQNWITQLQKLNLNDDEIFIDTNTLFQYFVENRWVRNNNDEIGLSQFTNDELKLIQNLESNPKVWISTLSTHFDAHFGDCTAQSIAKLCERDTQTIVSLAQKDLIPESTLQPIFDKAVSSISQIREQTEQYKQTFTNISQTQSHVNKHFKRHNFLNTKSDIIDFLAMVNCALYLEHGYTLYDTQLLAAIAFIDSTVNNINRLADISTGEGKSLISEIAALAIALRGDTVDVITSSKALAEPDAIKAESMFKYFDISVDNICDSKAEKSETERMGRYLKNNVLYGDLAAFERDYLLDKFFDKNLRPSKKGNHRIVIDEVDNLFIDNTDKVLYISHPIEDLKYLRHIFSLIWQCVHAPDVYQPSVSNTIKIKKMVLQALKTKTISAPKSLESFIKNRIKVWIDNAYTARETVTDRDYSVLTQGEHADKPIINDLMTGVEQPNAQWSNGLHQFLELKHRKALSDETLRAVFISDVSYLKRFTQDGFVLGMTGTLGDSAEQEMLVEIYNVDFFTLPKLHHERFQNLQGEVVGGETQNNWLNKISQSVQSFISPQTHLTQKEISAEKVSLVELESSFKANQLLLKSSQEEYKSLSQEILIDTQKRDALNFQIQNFDIQTLEQSAYSTETNPRSKLISKRDELNNKITTANLALENLKDQSSEFENTIADILSDIESAQNRIAGKNGRAVLLICENKRSAKMIFNKLNDDLLNSPNLHKLYLYDSYLETFTLETNKLISGDVLVATNIAGRGYDLKVNKHIEKLGGLHVTLTYMPSSIRIEEQAIGRAGRNGVAGSASFIVYDKRATKTNPVTISQLKDERDVQESKRLNRIRQVKIKQINLEQKLAEQFEIFQTEVQDALKKDDPDFKALQIKALHNKWAFWLDAQGDNIQKAHEDAQGVLNAFESFKTQIKKLLNQDSEKLITTPGELLNLGHYYMAVEDYYSAKRCYDKIIDEQEDDFAGFAHYYRAQATIMIAGDPTKYKPNAISDLEKAVKLFDNESDRLSAQSQIVQMIARLHQKQGKAISSDLFTKTNADEMGIFSIHKMAAQQAMGFPLSARLFDNGVFFENETESVFNAVRKELSSSILRDYHLNPDIKIQTDSNNTLALYKNNERLNFPTRCKNISQPLFATWKNATGQYRYLDQNNITHAFMNTTLAANATDLSPKLWRNLIEQNIIIEPKASYRAFTHNKDTVENKLKYIKDKVEEKLNNILKAIPSAQARATHSKTGEESKEAFKNAIIEIITQSIGTIQTLPKLELDNRVLNDYFAEHDVIPPVVRAYMQTAAALVINIIEKVEPKGFCWECFLIAILGVIEIVAGALLIAIGLPNLGNALISEGIGDIIYGIEAQISGEFSWEAYGKHKLQSLAISLLTAGVGSYLSTAAPVSQHIGRTILKELGNAALDVGAQLLINTITSELSSQITQGVLDDFRKKYPKQVEDHKKDNKALVEDIKKLYRALGKEDAKKQLSRCFQEINIRRVTNQEIANRVFGVLRSISSKLSSMGGKNAGSTLNKVAEASKLISTFLEINSYTMALGEISSISINQFNRLHQRVQSRVESIQTRDNPPDMDTPINDEDEFVDKQLETVAHQIVKKIMAKVEQIFNRAGSRLLNLAVQPLKNEIRSKINKKLYQLIPETNVEKAQRIYDEAVAKYKLKLPPRQKVISAISAQEATVESLADLIQDGLNSFKTHGGILDSEAMLMLDDATKSQMQMTEKVRSSGKKEHILLEPIHDSQKTNNFKLLNPSLSFGNSMSSDIDFNSGKLTSKTTPSAKFSLFGEREFKFANPNPLYLLNENNALQTSGPQLSFSGRMYFKDQIDLLNLNADYRVGLEMSAAATLYKGTHGPLTFRVDALTAELKTERYLSFNKDGAKMEAHFGVGATALSSSVDIEGPKTCFIGICSNANLHASKGFGAKAAINAELGVDSKNFQIGGKITPELYFGYGFKFGLSGGLSLDTELPQRVQENIQELSKDDNVFFGGALNNLQKSIDAQTSPSQRQALEEVYYDVADNLAETAAYGALFHFEWPSLKEFFNKPSETKIKSNGLSLSDKILFDNLKLLFSFNQSAHKQFISNLAEGLQSVPLIQYGQIVFKVLKPHFPINHQTYQSHSSVPLLSFDSNTQDPGVHTFKFESTLSNPTLMIEWTQPMAGFEVNIENALQSTRLAIAGSWKYLNQNPTPANLHLFNQTVQHMRMVCETAQFELKNQNSPFSEQLKQSCNEMEQAAHIPLSNDKIAAIQAIQTRALWIEGVSSTSLSLLILYSFSRIWQGKKMYTESSDSKPFEPDLPKHSTPEEIQTTLAQTFNNPDITTEQLSNVLIYQLQSKVDRTISMLTPHTPSFYAATNWVILKEIYIQYIEGKLPAQSNDIFYELEDLADVQHAIPDSWVGSLARSVSNIGQSLAWFTQGRHLKTDHKKHSKHSKQNRIQMLITQVLNDLSDLNQSSDHQSDEPNHPL